MAQMVKNLPAMRKTWVPSLGWKDPLEKGTTTHSGLENSMVCIVHGVTKSESVSHSVVSDSLRPHGLQPSRLLCSWDFPGKNTGVGCHALLQGTFLTQG